MPVGELYLVTGGCGFVGLHLVRELLRLGHRARVLDNLSSGDARYLPGEAELVVADVGDRSALASAMRGVSGCFHLAAVASVEETRVAWLAGHRTNAGGTVCVLEAARDRAEGPVPVVYASSAAVYGDSGDATLNEAVGAVPRSAYGADKLGGELHARLAAELFGVPTLGLRFFNVYGPGQRSGSPYSGVISRFCERLIHGQRLLIYGDGQQTRDFVYVDDVVRALLAGMRRIPLGGRVINVCTGHRTTIAEVAGTLATFGRVRPDFTHEPSRRGEVRHSCGCPRLLSQTLGVTAQTPLRKGLASTLAWYRERLAPEPRADCLSAA